MKHKARLLVVLLVVIVCLQCCSSGKKLPYNVPDNYTDSQRKEMGVQFKKGQELFRANCAECHGIFTGGKDSMPNFTSIQIDNYSARFLRHDAKNHAVTKQMSPEQLNEILTFLRYRKIKKENT